MLLYTNGCSMTYGAELADDPNNCHICLNDPYRLQNSWPGQLAKILDMDLKNDGYPGGSNDRIFRTTQEFVAKWIQDGKDPKDLFVVIGWTEPQRLELFIEAENRYWQFLVHLPEQNDKRLEKMFHLYIEKCFSEVEFNQRYYQQVVYLQSFLERYKIKYAFFNALINAPLPGLDHLANLINRKRFLNFERSGFTMHYHIVQNGFKLLPRYHPTVEGHAFWAYYLATQIMENGLLINES